MKEKDDMNDDKYRVVTQTGKTVEIAATLEAARTKAHADACLTGTPRWIYPPDGGTPEAVPAPAKRAVRA
jgi:hypothetical protein